MIATKKISFGCDNAFKKINTVTLQLEGKANVLLNGRYEVLVDNSELCPVKLTPGICGINLLDIRVTSDSPISLGSADIKYTQLSH